MHVMCDPHPVTNRQWAYSTTRQSTRTKLLFLRFYTAWDDNSVSGAVEIFSYRQHAMLERVAENGQELTVARPPRMSRPCRKTHQIPILLSPQDLLSVRRSLRDRAASVLSGKMRPEGDRHWLGNTC